MDTPEKRKELFIRLVKSPLPNETVIEKMTDPFADEHERLGRRLREIGSEVLGRLDQAVPPTPPSGNVIDMFSKRTLL